jgi:hypothetical protein
MSANPVIKFLGVFFIQLLASKAILQLFLQKFVSPFLFSDQLAEWMDGFPRSCWRLRQRWRRQMGMGRVEGLLVADGAGNKQTKLISS